MSNLTKLNQTRINQHKALEKNLLKKLKTILVLEKDTKIRLSRSTLDLCVLVEDGTKELFASNIDLMNNECWETKTNNLTINFGSSGSFTPEDRAPFVRTKHAMEILNHWTEIEPIILAFMKQVKRMEETWRFENELRA